MKLKYQWVAGALAVTIGWWASANVVLAADLPTFKLEMNDGKLNPTRIEVPAGQRIKIEVHNIGKGAAEFESVQLRKEKVLAPGADSFVVIAPLDPGEYKFFDDFHHTAQGVIVAK
jgi:Cupredoxin-like domain